MHDPITQHESALVPTSSGFRSLFEVNIWGQLYYATEVEAPEQEESVRPSIHLYSLLGNLLLYLEHGRRVIERLGYEGSLNCRLRMENVLGRQFWGSEGSLVLRGSLLDDTIDFSMELRSDRLRTDRDGIVKDLLRRFFFAVNSPDATTDEAVHAWLSYGYEFNRWPGPG